MTVKKLIEYGSITPEVAELLERMVKAKFNIFSGGTGSGKNNIPEMRCQFYSKR